MVGQSLFLFVDIKFLNVEDEFLFQSPFVVVHALEFGQSVGQALANALYASLFEGLDGVHEFFDAVQVLGKLLGKSLTLLTAEVNEVGNGLADGLANRLPVFFAHFFDSTGTQRVGQTNEDAPQPFTIEGNTLGLADGSDLG